MTAAARRESWPTRRTRRDTIHIGSMIRFIRPESASIVRTRLATSSANPAKLSAPSAADQRHQPHRSVQRHAEQESARPKQNARFEHEKPEPREQHGRADSRDGASASRSAASSSLRNRAWTIEKPDAPEAVAHDGHAEQSRQQPVHIACARGRRLLVPGRERIGPPRGPLQCLVDDPSREHGFRAGRDRSDRTAACRAR